MSTRSAIGILHDDGSVTAVYCHWDGYLSHTGKILLEHYNTLTKVRNLLKHGNISFIAERLGRKHDFDSASKLHPDWCLFYGRDRGESDQGSKAFTTTKEFEEHYSWSEYYYLFNNRRWAYKQPNDKLYKQLNAQDCVREEA